MSAPGYDLRIEDHESIAILQPLTAAASDWIADNIGETESWQWFGGGLCCEPRYVADIVAGMESDGLSVEVAS
jgi:hypothetical protein